MQLYKSTKLSCNYTNEQFFPNLIYIVVHVGTLVAHLMQENSKGLDLHIGEWRQHGEL